VAIANLKSPNDHFSLCDSLGCGRWVTEGRTVQEAIEIAEDVAKVLLDLENCRLG
jgi:hypothetical protein